MLESLDPENLFYPIVDIDGFSSCSSPNKAETTYFLTRTCSFMTADLNPFSCSFSFKRDRASSSSLPHWIPIRYTLNLYIEFKNEPKGKPAVITKADGPIENVRPYLGTAYVSRNITFVNFDSENPVYTEELIFLGVLWRRNLFMRAKVFKPYSDASFREITLSFYFDVEPAQYREHYQFHGSIGERIDEK